MCISGPAKGGFGERPSARETASAGEERAEDGALQRARDEREFRETTHLWATQSRYKNHTIVHLQIKVDSVMF